MRVGSLLVWRTMPISSDQPLTDPKDDALGFVPFAQNLAGVLTNELPEDGLVVALTGRWGSGKSTALNFLRHELTTNPVRMEKTIVVRFNPWWFSGTDDLVRDYFAQLLSTLSSAGKNWSRVRSSVRDLAGAASKLPVKGKGIAGFIHQFLAREKPVAEIRLNASKALRKVDGRVIVLVDDIDRLTPDETRDLFRVIKAVADLPRVGYVLAFDRDIVTQALGRMYSADAADCQRKGADYLEKIVQLEVQIPTPSRLALRSAILQKLAWVLEELRGEEQTGDWMNVFHDGIEKYMETPRDLSRYSNVVAATWPAVRGEVHLPDFLAIQALRVFAAPAYEAIVGNPSAFSGHREPEHGPGAPFHEEYLAQLEPESVEATRYVLMRVFPRLEAIWNNFHHGDHEFPKWRKNLRACIPDLLPVYFRLELPRDVVSRAEIDHALGLLDSPEDLAALLIAQSQIELTSGESRGRALLDRLDDELDKIEPATARNAIRGILLASGALLSGEPDQLGMGRLPVTRDIRFSVVRLLKQLPVDQRTDAIIDALDEQVDIEMSCYLIASLEQQQERQPRPADRIVRPDDLARLRQAGAAQVSRASSLPQFSEQRKLALLLLRWKQWAKEEAEKWLAEAIRDPLMVAQIVTSACSSSFSQTLGIFGMGDRFARRRPRIDHDILEGLYSQGELQAAVRSALESPQELNEGQQAACRLYLRGPRDDDEEEEYPADLLVGDLGLPEKVSDALSGAGIRTAHELEVMSDEELLAIKGIGPHFLKLVREALADDRASS